ncbi:MAG: hypothetical protein E7135_01040 [Rikenellaceae bacterium]|nr:hypothetical protein [Rikenellaceae bacterium]
MTSYNHLLHLILGQIMTCNSLRIICLFLNVTLSIRKQLPTKPAENLLNQSKNIKELNLLKF